MALPSTVLVLSPWTAGFYFGAILSGITRDVAGRGGRVVVSQTTDADRVDDSGIEAPLYTSHVAWDHADGAIAVAGATRNEYLEELRAAGKRVTLASNRVGGFDAPVAMPDNEGGTRAAVQHLIEHGHTRIGFGGNLSNSDIRERYTAYHETLVEHGLEPDPNDFYPAVDNVETGGVSIAEAFLRQESRPTAVVVATDRNALTFMQAVLAADLDVPRDVAVVGYDNVEAGAFSSPPLSTVDQRFDRIGSLASRLLHQQLEGEHIDAVEHPASARVVTRASCGCAGNGHHEEPDGIAAAEPAQRLMARLTQALVNSASSALVTSAVAEAHQAIVAVADGVVREGARAEPSHDVLKAILTPLSAHIEVPIVLQHVERAITLYLRELTATTDPEDAPTHAALLNMTARTSIVLWHLQTGLYLGRVAVLEASLHEQYNIGVRLLGSHTADPRRLDWLAGSHVRAGVLALWNGEDLVIEGVHDPEGRLGDLRGTVTTTPVFPPAAMVAASDPAQGEVVYVLPLRRRGGRDWGLLAVTGPVDTTSGRETYNHWAALLCEAFDQEALLETLRSSEERHGLLARAMNEGLWEWSNDGASVMSSRCRALLGLGEDGSDEVLTWHEHIDPDDFAALRREVQSVLDGDKHLAEIEVRYRGPRDAEPRWLLLRAMPVPGQGRGMRRVLGSLSDIDDRKRLEERLRHNAMYDAATGLPNRRMFLERLERSIERWQETRTPFAVVFLDLDRFKVVNDSLGHQAGDLLLRGVSDRLRGVLRSQDTAARFGGDEFAILIDGVVPDAIPAIARRIQDSLSRPVEVEGHALWVTASLGITSSSVDYRSADDVLRDADTAMYHAKSHEPGTLSYFDAAMHAEALHHVHLQAAVQDGLDRGEFEVFYQPIVQLTQAPVGRFEALVRWNHPDRGVLLPGEFLPLMEETGLVVRLGLQVIADVCAQIAAWRATYDGPVNVSINVSDREFWHAGLVDHVRACLARHGLEPSCLTMEVTEGVIMRRPELAQQLMSRMREAGLRLHIDDFGAGHSSLQTLHRYPVEALKIDRSFVHELVEGKQSRELVRAIVAMGGALGLEVIAEGIETPEQLAVLREVGCDIGQGFLFDQAVRGDRAAELLGHSFAALALADHPVVVG
ncbi:EAL domain-containing protein [Cellulomonas sp. P22]|uniref:EAL domain-containing protein n=1 Tax=Cellulomonas sp. P22 TaxID=3373189 RepID=UPI0037A3272C